MVLWPVRTATGWGCIREQAGTQADSSCPDPLLLIDKTHALHEGQPACWRGLVRHKQGEERLPVRSMTCHATAASLVEIDGGCRSVGSQTLAVSLICRGAGFEGQGVWEL